MSQTTSPVTPQEKVPERTISGTTRADTEVGVHRLVQRIHGEITSDGAGVKLTRLIGTPQLQALDPFLLLDAFGSDEPQEYLAGFPPHPHRGFETVTYLLAGRMRHRDNAGHEGVIEPGGVQWMTAGRGIVHSEMPEQENGRLAGFQLWVNLPAAEKMGPPRYQEIDPNSVPVEARPGGVQVRVIAGRTRLGTLGPVAAVSTAPLYLDVRLPAGTAFEEPLPATHNAFVYVMEGALNLGAAADGPLLSAGELGVLAPEGAVRVVSQGGDARFLLVAGRRLNEPVARGGPFVMNSPEEIAQAFRDYREGRF